ncbi:MAG: phosphotransferase family protein [Arthrobacter sp.]|uniref:phosphotransferase family protein n=1 Tax=unclassified Arthrobacter TaxID=235627 RepID=UPI0026522F10|nr:aminoglycoside phosphotransferase family protein [Micrococcaceae bacterium]MDN5811817.1 aminoglycoside phosphotransferase family protein [Micrococcaceae bacterium]MDN5879796.1 aminoglycoside phosphotransferase family protein [Micrococcaceae bacterium]MDN5885664.1 aminoglycoside phosphotransferase family protein [Micrococcaceae bacterium]MDN5904437.1 aminoglycoside phosphotransferase family protein [Micrococcaceae bacterium]
MTSSWGLAGLSPRQRARLDQLYPRAHGIVDHSWPYGITVLEFIDAGRRLLLKACQDTHHLDREARAHRNWLQPLASDVPEMLGYDAGAGLLVKTFIDGELATGSRYEHDPLVFKQAGELLGRLHRGTVPVLDGHYEHSVLSKTLTWLDRAPGLAPPEQLSRVQRWLDAFTPSPVEVVPTHGDYHPRNWIGRPDGRIAIIDFGRAGLRPWYTDMVRMEHRDFLGSPQLREAFRQGYRPKGAVPPAGTVDAGRLLDELMQSLGTVVWAHQVGDQAFEEQGRGMLARTLQGSGFPPH